MLRHCSSIVDQALPSISPFPPPLGAVVWCYCKVAGVSELIVAELANEGGLAVEPGNGDGDGDVSKGVARGLEDAGTLRKGHVEDGGDSRSASRRS